MKQAVCMIGPFPPPMNGNSKAFDTIIKSEKCNSLFKFAKIDLYRLYSGKNGKMSFSKVFGIFALKKAIMEMRRKERIDTYYISNAQSAVGCIRDIVVIKEILKQKKNCRIILHLHGGGFKNFYNNTYNFLRKLIKKYYSYADRVIVLGPSLMNMFDGIVEENNVVVIPNCVDDEMLLTDGEFEEKMSLLRKTDTYQVLYLSSMIETKGYKDLLKSAIKYNEFHSDMKFVFAGSFRSSKDEEEFNSLVNENNLEDRIKYVGVVNGAEKRQLLFSSNIFVLPTYYPNEGQPISIIECMSAGMAIIATDHAGIRDLVEENVNGIFVMKKNPDSIVHALEALSEKDKIIELSGNSRDLSIHQYTESQYITNICDVLGMKSHPLEISNK